MRDRHRGERRAREELLEPDDALDVEVVRRLVEEEEVGLPDELAREGDALLLPARERRHEAVGADAAGRERELRERLVRLQLGLPRHLLAVGDVGEGPLEDDGPDGRPLREARDLGDEADGDASLEDDRPVVGRRLLGEDRQERRLPRAVRPDQADPLVRLDPEREAGEEGPGAKRLREALRGDEGRHAATLAEAPGDGSRALRKPRGRRIRCAPGAARRAARRPPMIKALGYGNTAATAPLDRLRDRPPRPRPEGRAGSRSSTAASATPTSTRPATSGTGTTYPCIPGHEIVGRVSAVGAEVKGFKVGDLAGVGCMVDSCRDVPRLQGRPRAVLPEGRRSSPTTAPTRTSAG